MPGRCPRRPRAARHLGWADLPGAPRRRACGAPGRAAGATPPERLDLLASSGPPEPSDDEPGSEARADPAAARRPPPWWTGPTPPPTRATHREPPVKAEPDAINQAP